MTTETSIFTLLQEMVERRMQERMSLDELRGKFIRHCEHGKPEEGQRCPVCQPCLLETAEALGPRKVVIDTYLEEIGRR